jgi:hypothetical protein
VVFDFPLKTSDGKKISDVLYIIDDIKSSQLKTLVIYISLLIYITDEKN